MSSIYPAHCRTPIAALCITLAWLADPASAQNPPGLAETRAEAEQTIARIEETLEQRPNDGMLQYYMAMFQSQAGHRDEAIEWLKRVAARRMGFQPTPGGGFDDLWADAEFQQILRDIAANETRVAGADEVFRLPDATFVPEGIAYDARQKRHFIGSIRHRRIVERTRDGKFAVFSAPADGLKAVLGLHVDAARGLLYAVSTNSFSRPEGEAPENALFVYDLKSRQVRARYRAPEAINLNDVAVGPSGEVVVTDSGAAAVYRLDAQNGDLVFLVPPRTVSSANGIAFAPDGKRVFVAAATGIVAVDLATGNFNRLVQPDDIATGGIDGLYFYGGDLIGVQNFINPGRVVRLDLDEAGEAIIGLTVLQAYHPSLDEPTTGTIVGKTLHVIANSSVSRVQPDGSLREEATLEPASILAVPLTRP